MLAGARGRNKQYLGGRYRSGPGSVLPFSLTGQIRGAMLPSRAGLMLIALPTAESGRESVTEIPGKRPRWRPAKLRAVIVALLLIVIIGSVARTVWQTIAYNIDYARPTESPVGADPSRPKKMLLQIGPDRYWQDTDLPFGDTTADKLPYAGIKFERTTWGEWRTKHPDTDIYVGSEQIRPVDGAYKIAPSRRAN